MFDRRVPEIFARQACPESNRRAAKLERIEKSPFHPPEAVKKCAIPLLHLPLEQIVGKGGNP
jgi:hypothetical protein